MQERKHEILFLRPGDFRLKLKPHSVPSANGDKRVPLANRWLDWPGRRQYEAVVFAPGADLPPDQFNLFRGWGVPSLPTYGETV